MANIDEDKRGVGRPKTPIDEEQFEKLCAMQCTENEIASFFGCDRRTIQRWCQREYDMTFEEVFAEFRQAGKASLRRSQWTMAQSNPTMAIFLGKQYLGQQDNYRQDVRHTVSIDDTAKAMEDYFSARKGGKDVKVGDDNGDGGDEE